MHKTLIVWRRLGKEHGEETGFRVNPPDLVAGHVETQQQALRRTPEAQWRWWQVREDLLVEQVPPQGPYLPGCVAYYLPKRDWLILEKIRLRRLGPEWTWYVHIGDIAYDARRACWIMTDLFVDVIVQPDDRTHSVLDLNDLAHALEIGLVNAPTLCRVLRSTQGLVDLLLAGGFPPPEVHEARALMRSWPPVA